MKRFGVKCFPIHAEFIGIGIVHRWIVVARKGGEGFSDVQDEVVVNLVMILY